MPSRGREFWKDLAQLPASVARRPERARLIRNLAMAAGRRERGRDSGDLHPNRKPAGRDAVRHCPAGSRKLTRQAGLRAGVGDRVQNQTEFARSTCGPTRGTGQSGLADVRSSGYSGQTCGRSEALPGLTRNPVIAYHGRCAHTNPKDQGTEKQIRLPNIRKDNPKLRGVVLFFSREKRSSLFGNAVPLRGFAAYVSWGGLWCHWIKKNCRQTAEPRSGNQREWMAIWLP